MYRTYKSGTKRGSPNYHAAPDHLPEWIRVLAEPKTIVGVYENMLGTPSNALVFYEDAMLILDEAGCPRDRLAYDDIARPIPFCKDPVSQDLTVFRKDGTSVTFDTKAHPYDVSLFTKFTWVWIRHCTCKSRRQTQFAKLDGTIRHDHAQIAEGAMSGPREV
ncbi:MAG: hypothetical protein HC927_01990, partial [Deltaproteobacteria bacterium]|nr:hypothetical protein [Deltaproteobacteria bacterium]